MTPLDPRSWTVVQARESLAHETREYDHSARSAFEAGARWALNLCGRPEDEGDVSSLFLASILGEERP